MIRKLVICAIAAVAVFHLYPRFTRDAPQAVAAAASTPRPNDAIAAAFASRRSGILVRGAGTVSRMLADDDDGSRHQRFILALPSGHTVLIAHNIDLAPRIEGLRSGDRVEFSGEYEWNPQGGVVHWTHHDPQGRHAAGWLRHADRTYQ
jgi:hypothetical protein